MALDEHLTRPWEPDGEMATSHLRRRRRAAGRPNWRIVRYADDLVVLVDGARDDVETLREDIADVLQPLGLRLSEAKCRRTGFSPRSRTGERPQLSGHFGLPLDGLEAV
ncbi:hypothetical protein ACFVXV_32800, partial [Streptomyces sp. NPDC058272]